LKSGYTPLHIKQFGLPSGLRRIVQSGVNGHSIGLSYFILGGDTRFCCLEIPWVLRAVAHPGLKAGFLELNKLGSHLRAGQRLV
jgi:hypothetical protein